MVLGRGGQGNPVLAGKGEQEVWGKGAFEVHVVFTFRQGSKERMEGMLTHGTQLIVDRLENVLF